MGNHVFEYAGEDAINHNFVCSKCGALLDFNKPEFGEPNADTSGPTPVPPPNAEIYLPPCEAQ